MPLVFQILIPSLVGLIRLQRRQQQQHIQEVGGVGGYYSIRPSNNDARTFRYVLISFRSRLGVHVCLCAEFSQFHGSPPSYYSMLYLKTFKQRHKLLSYSLSLPPHPSLCLAHICDNLRIYPESKDDAAQAKIHRLCRFNFALWWCSRSTNLFSFFCCLVYILLCFMIVFVYMYVACFEYIYKTNVYRV